MKIKRKKIIGRREFIDLPQFGLYHFEAKIDTGAYTSAIHCSHIALVTEANKMKITFHIPQPDNPQTEEKIFETKFFKLKNIKNSFGQTEERYVIRTTIRIGKKRIRAEFSLSDRTEMRYPVLLGRKLLKDRFLIDVSLCHRLSLDE